MSANLMISPELERVEATRPEERVRVCESKPRSMRWLLVSIQVFALIAYGTGLAFLIKTTVGTLVLFSLLAPLLVVITVLTLVGIGIYEIRRQRGISGFEIYDTGQIIFRQGELGDCAYFIQSGEVEVIQDENGSENVVAKLSEGEYFGEKALIRPEPRSATTRAATQTRVAVIRKGGIFTVVIVASRSWVPRQGRRNHKQ